MCSAIVIGYGPVDEQMPVEASNSPPTTALSRWSLSGNRGGQARWMPAGSAWRALVRSAGRAVDRSTNPVKNSNVCGFPARRTQTLLRGILKWRQGHFRQADHPICLLAFPWQPDDGLTVSYWTDWRKVFKTHWQEGKHAVFNCMSNAVFIVHYSVVSKRI